MKIRHFLLGAAVIALMASCGSKATTETATESPVETMEETVTETMEETVAEEAPVEAPAQKSNKTTAKKSNTNSTTQTAKADPCEAKVKAFEKYVDQLKEAKKNKKNGATALKAYVDLKAKAASMESTIQECTSNPDYKTRLTNAILAEKTARSN